MGGGAPGALAGCWLAAGWLRNILNCRRWLAETAPRCVVESLLHPTDSSRCSFVLIGCGTVTNSYHRSFVCKTWRSIVGDFLQFTQIPHSALKCSKLSTCSMPSFLRAVVFETVTLNPNRQPAYIVERWFIRFLFRLYCWPESHRSYGCRC